MEPFTLATCSTILHVFKSVPAHSRLHVAENVHMLSNGTFHTRDTFAFSQSENGLSQWCHQRIIALAANDDEFVSNIALIESVKNWKNCCILWESRIEEYKVIEKKTANWTKLAQNLRLFVGRYARFVGLHPVYTKTLESCCQWMFTDSNCSQSAVNDWWSV